jgi:hypothetical protein
MPLARHLAVSLAAGLALLVAPGLASAAVIPVTITEDIATDDGECSLAEAVTAAGTDEDGTGGCVATGVYGDDTIDLDVDSYQVDATLGHLTLPAGAGRLTFDGVPGSTSIQAVGEGSRLFSIPGAAVVDFEGVILENGQAADGADGDSPGEPGTAGQGGGCVLSNGGILTFTDSVVRNCQAGDGGAGAQGDPGDPGGNGGIGGPGGAILAAGGILTLINTDVTGNQAGDGGGAGPGGAGMDGAVGGDGGTGGTGGGISAADTVEITGGTIGENVAGDGGAGGTGGDDSTTPGGGGNAGDGAAGGGLAVGGDLTMENVTVSANDAGTGGNGGDGGQVVDDIIGNGGDGGDGGTGGGLATALGVAHLEGVAIDDNQAGSGGQGGQSNPSAPIQIGDGGSGGAGGGWFSADQSPDLIASTVTGNASGSAGGGNIFDTEIAGGHGGGIRTENVPDLEVERTTVAGNTAGGTGFAGEAGAGGGVSLFLSGMSMRATAVTGNDAGDAGDATAGDGGGIHVGDNDAEVSIRNSTIAQNSAGSATAGGLDGRGGGVVNADGSTTVFLISNTVAENSVPADGGGGGLHSVGGMNLLSTIVAGNQAGTASDNCSGDFTDQAFNITFGDASCPIGAVVDPKLGPLADNGGPTETMGLNPGSPALDQIPEAGPPADACPPADQRGIARPVGGACDIGAFEGVLPGPGGPGGPAGPGGPGGPTGEAAFGQGTLVKLSLGAKSIKAKGPISVVVANGNDFEVKGSVGGRTTRAVATAAQTKRRPKKRIALKSKGFTVAASTTKTVRLALPRKLRRLLKRNKKLSLRITAAVTDPAGNSREVSRVLKPKLKKPKKRKR